MANILYTVAFDEKGALVKALNAEKKQNYRCPHCGTPVILRKSGSIAKNSKRPHFAHQALTPNCTPESALHFSFKHLLAQYLSEQITNVSPVLISWRCQFCGVVHEGNLLKKIKSVKVEYFLEGCTPDIALLDNNNSVIATIEIVVTHKPEPAVIDYCHLKNIVLIQINVTSDIELDNIVTKISNPDSVFYCYNKKCTVCSAFMQKKYLFLFYNSCYKCGEIMVVPGVRFGNSNRFIDPNLFDDEEIHFAINNGVNIRKLRDKENNTYIGIACGTCKTFVKKRFISPNYYHPISKPNKRVVFFEIGKVCINCDSRMNTLCY